ncbi:MAG: hypothetical protein H7834_08060 [Magnetococcus sp. YQC-9]
MQAKQAGLIAMAALLTGIVATLLIWMMGQPGAKPMLTLPVASQPAVGVPPVDAALANTVRERTPKLPQLRTPIIRNADPVPLTMLGFSGQPSTSVTR